MEPMGELHSPEKLRKILDRERSRSDRTGQELSLVLFEVGHPNAVVARPLADLLTRRIRSTDEVGWYDGYSIGVVLPSTAGEGALKFTDDICTKMAPVTQKLQFTVYTYPTRWLPDGKRSPGHPELPGVVQRLDRIMLHELARKGDSPSSRRIDPNSHLSSDRSQGSGKHVQPLESLFVLRLPVWKRVIDVLGATIILAVVSPLMIAAAAAIKLTSPGPIIFRQERIGLFGNRFTFLKFRSMVVNNDPEIHQTYIKGLIKNGTAAHGDEHDDPVYKIKDDPRVTPVGKFLRKTSMDELPQLINVLKGEMSLVGPRPPIPYEIMEYEIWHKRRILDVKPGITGLWQVKGRSRTTFDEMVRLDLKYIRECSLWLDLKILLKTPLAVFSSRGAY